MRLFASRRTTASRARPSLTLPLVGTSQAISGVGNLLEEPLRNESYEPSTSRTKRSQQFKGARFGFLGCAKISSACKSTKRQIIKRKNSALSKGTRGPPDDLLALMQDKRRFLLKREEELMLDLQALSSSDFSRSNCSKENLDAIQEQVQSCRQELKENQEQFDLMLFRYNAGISTLQSLSIHSIPEVNNSLRQDEDNFVLEPANDTATTMACQKKISSYIFQECIGRGAHGTVWKATTSSSRNAGKQQYAIKVVSKATLGHWHQVVQLDNEIRALQTLSAHPNILSLHRVIHGPAQVYLVTELAWTDAHQLVAPSENKVSGSKVKDKSGSWRSSVEEIAVGVLRALKYLHGKGFAHLDIKPENILLADTGSQNERETVITADQVRLCDFGYCQRLPGRCGDENDVHPFCEEKKEEDEDFSLDEQTNPAIATVIGTLGFIAPELMGSNPTQGNVMCACDMWSLGATLLDLLVGLSDDWMETYTEALEDGRDRDDPIGASHVLTENLQLCLAEMKRPYTSQDGLLKWICEGLLVTSPHDRISASSSLRQEFWVDILSSSARASSKARDLC